MITDTILLTERSLGDGLRLICGHRCDEEDQPGSA